jgi:hypothetical protein
MLAVLRGFGLIEAVIDEKAECSILHEHFSD